MKTGSTVIDRDGSDTIKKTKRPKPPRKYKVIYHNDDYNTRLEHVLDAKSKYYNDYNIFHFMHKMIQEGKI